MVGLAGGIRGGLAGGVCAIRCLARQAKLIAQDAGANFLYLAGFQLVQAEGAIAGADQPVHRQADGRHGAADLAVLAFAQADGQPGIRALVAVEHDLHGLERLAFDGDPLAERFQIGIGGVALHPDTVFAQPAGGGQFKAALEFAVIGEKEKTFGIEVEPAHGHDAGHVFGKMVEDGVAALFIGGRGDQPFGFVIEPEARGLRRGKGLAVHGDAVFRADIQGGTVDHLAVHGDLARGDHPFRLAPGGDAGAGKHLGDAVAFGRGACGGFGRAGHGVVLQGPGVVPS